MLRNTNKATVSKGLEKMGSIVENILSACIIDAMSLVQETIENHKTFAQVTKELFVRMMDEAKDALALTLSLTYTNHYQ